MLLALVACPSRVLTMASLEKASLPSQSPVSHCRANANMGPKRHMGCKPGWAYIKHTGVTPAANASEPPHSNTDVSRPTNPAPQARARASSRGAPPSTSPKYCAVLAGTRRWLPLIAKTAAASDLLCTCSLGSTTLLRGGRGLGRAICRDGSHRTLVMGNGGSQPNALQEMSGEPINDTNAYM